MLKPWFHVSLSVNRRPFKIGPFAQRRKPTTDERRKCSLFSWKWNRFLYKHCFWKKSPASCLLMTGQCAGYLCLTEQRDIFLSSVYWHPNQSIFFVCCRLTPLSGLILIFDFLTSILGFQVYICVFLQDTTQIQEFIKRCIFTMC